MFAKKIFDRNEIYFQAGNRNRDRQALDFKKGIREQAAIVIGHKLNIESQFFDFTNQTEFRYYGQSFNRKNYTEGVQFREDVTQRPLYANTIGDHLYSLRKFETPFSQWAVFTEYEGMNIAGISLSGNLKYKHSTKTEVDLTYDLNQLFAGRDTAFLIRQCNNFMYPFFTMGFYYKPVPGVKAAIILTNKGMNLDLSYPAFYLFKKPYLGIKMSMLF